MTRPGLLFIQIQPSFFFCHVMSTEAPLRLIGKCFGVTIIYISYMMKAVRNHLAEKWDHPYMRMNERRLIRYALATAEVLGNNLRMANPERNTVIGFIVGTCQQIQRMKKKKKINLFSILQVMKG